MNTLESVKLTGKKRYRLQRFTNKLILQVQYSFIAVIPCGPSFDSRRGTAWRDAKVTDLADIQQEDE